MPDQSAAISARSDRNGVRRAHTAASALVFGPVGKQLVKIEGM
jgi:hypothetical protein